MKLNTNEVMLCCGKGRCPILRHIEGENYEIKDDDGNTIKISRTQLNLIEDALTDLKDKCSTKS